MLRSLPVLLMLAGAAQAANLNFNGSNVGGCSYTSGTQTYNCISPSLGPNDTAVIFNGYTVVLSVPVSFTSGQGLKMSGTAKLQTTGNNAIDLSGSQNLNISGGTVVAGGAFILGSNAQSITANVTAASVTTAGASTSITGTVTASGAINLGSNSTITGAVSGASITTNSSVSLGALTISGAINLGSSNTVNGSVSGASIITNSTVTINGSVSTPGGTADLGSSIKISGSVTAGTVKTNSPGQIGGAVISAGTVDLGSGITVGGNVSGTTITTNSPVSITGNVDAKNSFTLGSGGSVTGNITAPTVTLNASGITVKGNIAASSALDIGSGSTVNGNISGGALTLRASSITVNGNATFTGDVDMGSGTTINGDLAARNVVTRSSNAVINGNAAVNSIYIDWGNSVTKTITCTGAPPGAPTCSCVTKADSAYNPTCGAAQSAGPHHIQITHSGQGLTCQAQSVTLKACGDSSCSTTYNGNTTVTLLPGGGSAFSFSGSTTATVRYPTATDSNGTPLSATVTGVSNANVCPNASTGTNNCNMVFQDNGLQLSASDHVAMTSAALSVQAFKSAPNGGSCVPLVQGNTDIKFSCKYMNPSTANGAASSPVIINGTPVACGSGSTTIKLNFDSTGLVTPTPTLQYAEVGQVGISASYAGSGGTANLAASGSDDFIAAPASFKLEATRVTTGGSFVSGVFGNPTDLFTLKVSALNAANSPAVTSNFGKEDAAESFVIAPVLKYPSVGVLPYTKGSFAAISGGIGSSSSGSAGQWHFDDVGTITLNAKLANASTYYMGKSITGFATKGTLDLRFVPHHFNTTLAGVNLMDCTKVGVVNPCAPVDPNGKFMYSKQNFDLRVTAYNDAASTSVSQNYVDKLSQDAEGVAKTITMSLWTASGGTTAATFGTGGFTPNVVFAFSKGVGAAIAAPLPAISFNYGLPDTVAVPQTVFIRASDDDTITSKRDTGSVEAPLTIVSGRMQVTNNYGSATSPLPVMVQAQYYSAAGSYVFNPQFPPVSPADEAKMTIGSNISYVNCQKGLAVSGNTCAAPGPTATLVRPHAGVLTFNAGNASFLLAAPKLNGSVDVRLAPEGWTPAAVSPIPFLPSSTYGRETFGIYRSGPVIYTREVHN